MYATQVMIGMTFLRIILPVAALLAIGEWANRYGRGSFYRK
jgi:hypothetical protein